MNTTKLDQQGIIEHCGEVILPPANGRAWRFGDTGFATHKSMEYVSPDGVLLRVLSLCLIEDGKAYAWACFEDGKLDSYSHAKSLGDISAQWLKTITTLERLGAGI